MEGYLWFFHDLWLESCQKHEIVSHQMNFKLQWQLCIILKIHSKRYFFFYQARTVIIYAIHKFCQNNIILKEGLLEIYQSNTIILVSRQNYSRLQILLFFFKLNMDAENTFYLWSDRIIWVTLAFCRCDITYWFVCIDHRNNFGNFPKRWTASFIFNFLEHLCNQGI